MPTFLTRPCRLGFVLLFLALLGSFLPSTQARTPHEKELAGMLVDYRTRALVKNIRAGQITSIQFNELLRGSLIPSLPSTGVFLYPSFEPTVTNRRLIAYTDAGIADGIKIDRLGNLWIGCGDGVQIFSKTSGTLLGKVNLPQESGESGSANTMAGKTASVANLTFVGNNKLVLLAEQNMYLVTFTTPAARP